MPNSQGAATWRDPPSLLPVLATVTHEFHSHLASLRYLLKRLDDAPPDTTLAQVRHILEMVQDSANSAEEVVTAFAAITRMGEWAPAAVEVDVVALIATSVERYREMVDEPPIELRAPSTLMLCTDDTLVCLILRNLLHNVAAHAPTATRAVVELRRESRGAVVVVEDDGPGVPPERLARLFRRQKPEGGGLGFGLYLCRQAALVMGGDITYEDSASSGARFVLRLPDLPEATRKAGAVG